MTARLIGSLPTRYSRHVGMPSRPRSPLRRHPDVNRRGVLAEGCFPTGLSGNLFKSVLRSLGSQAGRSLIQALIRGIDGEEALVRWLAEQAFGLQLICVG